MKKAIIIFLSITMLLSSSACSSNTESSESTSMEIVQTSETIQLINKMTEIERSRVDKHALTLLDEPVDPADIDHKVSIEFETKTPDDMRDNLESMRDDLTDDEYEQAVEGINNWEESGEAFLIPYMR